MKRDLKPTTACTRIICAGSALLATVVIGWSLLTLVEHYDDQYLQVARSQSAVATQHAQAPAPVPATTAHHG